MYMYSKELSSSGVVTTWTHATFNLFKTHGGCPLSTDNERDDLSYFVTILMSGHGQVSESPIDMDIFSKLLWGFIVLVSYKMIPKAKIKL